MKVCNVCNVEKTLSEFYVRKGQHSGQCKGCEKEKSQRRVKERLESVAPMAGKAVESGAKICPRCKEAKSLDHFHASKNSPDGHVCFCKSCMKGYVSSRYQKLKTESCKTYPDYKMCRKCGEEKAKSNFVPHPFTKDGLSAWCGACMNKYRIKRRKDDPQKALWSQAKARSRARGIPFDINIDDVVIPERCPVFGIEWRSGSNDTVPSLDRIVPEKGYVKGNVVVVSMRANRMKSEASIQELQTLADFYSKFI